MKYKHFYSLSLLSLAAVSVYPLYMGALTLAGYLTNGFVSSSDYQRYVIPYAPICLALIISAAIMPLIFKLFRRFSLLTACLTGTSLFLAFELIFEQIKVVDGDTAMKLKSYQLSLCIATPDVLRSLGKPIFAGNNPAFKIHFYIISIVIILGVLNIINGFSRMLREQDFGRKRPLIAQAVSVTLFIGLCILACFTAFYRNGTINISPLSATLMSIFFIVFGITSGTFLGSILYGRSRFQSLILPSAAATLTTLVMYIGELVLMDGALFKYGSGFLFAALKPMPFSAVDILIMLASGIITYYSLFMISSAFSSNKRCHSGDKKHSVTS